MPRPTAVRSAARTTDTQALAEQLYRTHRPQLIAVARRNCDDRGEAEEALHDAFILFIDHYDPSCGSPPLGWLILTLKRRCWATYQRRRLGRKLTGGEQRPAATHKTPPEAVDRHHQGPQESAELGEAVAAVHAQLARLRPSERRALTLLSLGYSYREICTVTGWTYTKVRRSIYEGRLKLRDRLDPELVAAR